ncbi:hypothetical protein [Cryobacterium sp. PH31-L1]|uniref:hypothetical protein n=1 Tax=Cryobacterium sp. PH31-L1 TaxID=3046199 RepID=UPI0024BB7006|nr:hypothetical protein [Cryobacterium sp. PH31-L1]MDJ0379211.1 hypothetical protein [Cryobacterium sp. PH31-L1]
MNSFQRRIATFIGCALAVCALTSCSAPDTLAVFDQPQSKADTIPAGATPTVVEDLDADTTRLLWTDAGLSYYAALSDAGDQCVVIVDDLEAVSGCSSNLPITLRSGGSATIMLAENLPDESADWTKVADHLWRAT